VRTWRRRYGETVTGILILHPGMSDADSWRGVASRLESRYRVLLPTRRRYRMDVDAPAGIGAEVSDAVELTVDGPVVLVGHSSGGVVALEALVAAPDRFLGAVLYEPPVVTDLPLGGAAILRAREAVDRGRLRAAIEIFLRDVVRVGRTPARFSSFLIAAVPRWRRLIPRQIADNEAVDALGDRRADYAGIRRPVLLIGGDRSPEHLGLRLDALEQALPEVRRVTLRGQGHGANRTAPAELARLIADFADRI
jgi:pimeloyl-ACP methyl ester carboxylesterase